MRMATWRSSGLSAGTFVEITNLYLLVVSKLLHPPSSCALSCSRATPNGWSWRRFREEHGKLIVCGADARATPFRVPFASPQPSVALPIAASGRSHAKTGGYQSHSCHLGSRDPTPIRAFSRPWHVPLDTRRKGSSSQKRTERA